MSRSDIPIRFYCEVFETFRNLFYDDTITLSDNERKYVKLIRELSVQLSHLETIEKNQEKLFKKFLNYIFIDLNPALTIENYKDSAYNTDGTVIKRVSGTEFVILNLEVKTDWGTQQCSYLQNAAYYAKFMKTYWNANGQYTEKTSYPCFLLTLDGKNLFLNFLMVITVVYTFFKFYLGQQLTISGAIMSNVICIDKLTPTIPLDMAFYDSHTAIVAARAISALITCLQNLQNHYIALSNNQPIPKTFSNGPFPRFLTQIEKMKNFNYVERLGNKNLWLAEVEIDGSKQHVVVKFTCRYCREVHDACHNNGIAPKILYYVELDSDWSLIIMEYLQDYLSLDDLSDNKRINMHSNILKAVDILHRLHFVHGDLRGPNILIGPNDDVKFIDFDWSGKVGEAEYPESLNQFVNWHQDAGFHKKIYPSHDLHLVNWVLAGSKQVNCHNLCAWNKEY